VVEGWTIYNEGLPNSYASLNIIRLIKSGRMRLVEHVVRVGEIRNVYKILVGKREGRRPFRRPRHGWEENIGIVFK